MPLPSLSWLAPLVLALCSLPSLAAQDSAPSPERKAAPHQQNRAGKMFARHAVEKQWVRQLSSKDLLLRQSSYDKLLLRARLDPSVKGFMKRLALDQNRPELAWTARLGLRELDLREKLALSVNTNPLELITGPYGSSERLQAIMRQLVVEYPSWQFGIQELRPAEFGKSQTEQELGQDRRVRVRTDVLGVIVRSVAQSEKPKPGQRPGLEVGMLEPGSIAEVMQVRSGDVLLRVNGLPIFNPADITKAMQSQDKGAPIVVRWLDQTLAVRTETFTPDVR